MTDATTAFGVHGLSRYIQYPVANNANPIYVYQLLLIYIKLEMTYHRRAG